jgi:hypothetical protein
MRRCNHAVTVFTCSHAHGPQAHAQPPATPMIHTQRDTRSALPCCCTHCVHVLTRDRCLQTRARTPRCPSSTTAGQGTALAATYARTEFNESVRYSRCQSSSPSARHKTPLQQRSAAQPRACQPAVHHKARPTPASRQARLGAAAAAAQSTDFVALWLKHKQEVMPAAADAVARHAASNPAKPCRRPRRAPSGRSSGPLEVIRAPDVSWQPSVQGVEEHGRRIRARRLRVQRHARRAEQGAARRHRASGEHEPRVRVYTQPACRTRLLLPLHTRVSLRLDAVASRCWLHRIRGPRRVQHAPRHTPQHPTLTMMPSLLLYSGSSVYMGAKLRLFRYVHTRDRPAAASSAGTERLNGTCVCNTQAA